jgi:hypothetical protein
MCFLMCCTHLSGLQAYLKMDGELSILSEHPSGDHVTLSFYTAKAFRQACQRLLSQSETLKRTRQTTYHARFERVRPLPLEQARTKCEHGAPAPRAARAVPPPLVKRGEIRKKLGHKGA